MTSYPSESSLVVNATQQQLSAGTFSSGVAIAPTQHEESKGGYDIEFESATRLELQYKAVYGEVQNRSFQHATTQNGVKFPFNGVQAKTLLGRQTGPGIAFYALPIVRSVSDLGDILSSTVFVDVVGLETVSKRPDNFDEYTSFWVPVNAGRPTFTEVFLKDKTEPAFSKPEAYDRIPGQYVFTWAEFEQLARSNMLGVPIRIDGAREITQAYRQVANFESSVMEPRIRQLSQELRDKTSTESDVVGDIATHIARQNESVFRSIQQTREMSSNRWMSELRELIKSHNYLLSPEFDHGQQVASITTALTSEVDDRTELRVPEAGHPHDGAVPSEVDKVREKAEPPERDGTTGINYWGLDPRKGSRHRHYRFLTWGSKVDETIEAPIGFG